MKVTLVATVRDAGLHVGEFLEAVRGQTRAPDEVVIVDGGSTDGTLEILRADPAVTLIEEPGANISRGRNLAIAAATHDVVAVSDADCVPQPPWLDRLLVPIERGADVSMGAYRARAEGFFQACASAVAVPETDELRAETFLPSSRSVAFRREVVLDAGGYPEWLDRGEDMYLNLRLRERGARMELAADAVVDWRVRPTLAEHWRQYGEYARYDAIAGMHRRRHVIRFGVYAAAALAVATRRPALLKLGAAAGALYAARPIRRAVRRLPPHRRGAAVVVVPALMALTDVAKMAGYLRGLRERRRSR